MAKINALLDKNPELKIPEPKVVTEELKSGKTVINVMDEDPEYLAERRRIEELREEKSLEMMWLFTLRDVEPPDGWDAMAELGEEIAFYDPSWKPREGKVGKKLDYIEWVILADGANVTAINSALNELAGVSLEVASQTEDSFRGQVAREGA
jgi:hypothetical protein